jgi:lipopolysaccharide export system permease protein
VPDLHHRFPDRLDFYTLRCLAGPFALSLAVLLIAQLLERLLRLFDMAASTGAGIPLVLKMAGLLVPHYLGLAVPTAFFAAIFIAVARIGDDNELDAMLATGRSIARMAIPFFVVAVLLSVFNFYLFGYMQPLTRYGYHVAAHDALQAGWDARVEANRFVNASHGFTLTANEVGVDGRELQGVFVQRRSDDGEEIITARSGRLVPSADGKRLLLELQTGMIVSDNADGSARTVHFKHGRINEDFTAVPPPFRARGESARELTLPELWQKHPVTVDPAGSTNKSKHQEKDQRNGELQGRLARIVLPPLLPFLALPLGMAVKRGRRAPGAVFAAVVLLALNQTLQFGESMVESGRAPGWLAVWIPLALFGVFGIWLFRSSLQWPGDNPVMRAVASIEAAFEGISRKRKKAAA